VASPKDPPLTLRQRLHKRRVLNVTDRAAQLDDADVRLGTRVVDRLLGDALDPVLDLVGDVGHNLDRLAEVCADALLLDHVAVDLAGRDVVVAREVDGEVALVVAEV
jgi:hypothetical protein